MGILREVRLDEVDEASLLEELGRAEGSVAATRSGDSGGTGKLTSARRRAGLRLLMVGKQTMISLQLVG